MYRKISPDLKECAISLWERGFEITDIVAMLGVSRASIYRWQAIFDELGTVVRPTIRGRDRIISRAVVNAVLILFEADYDLYLDELALWLAVNHDIAISKSALQATLQRAGLTRKLLQKVASERDEELRHQWRELQAHPDLSGEGWEFVCVDETSKDERIGTFARHYGRSLSGTRAPLTDVFVRGDRYSLLCAITTEGYISAKAVEGLAIFQELTMSCHEPAPCENRKSSATSPVVLFSQVRHTSITRHVFQLLKLGLVAIRDVVTSTEGVEGHVWNRSLAW
ncbi:hypothetical protein D9611_000727 [Ephemerocybe angulata]|uniref:Uncharacterized protein n=1 Tax=Ephemerocybe angulata TaxID=980116 RepID=A0A8H5BQ79_9AGAR|nr:hypothetical protein D9611_000727 [Tulosesus angulatus]